MKKRMDLINEKCKMTKSNQININFNQLLVPS